MKELMCHQFAMFGPDLPNMGHERRRRLRQAEPKRQILGGALAGPVHGGANNQIA